MCESIVAMNRKIMCFLLLECVTNVLHQEVYTTYLNCMVQFHDFRHLELLLLVCRE